MDNNMKYKDDSIQIDPDELKRLMIQIGDRFRMQRIKYHMTQDQLAEILQCSTTHISEIERGNNMFSEKFLIKLFLCTPFSPNALFGGLESPLYSHQQYDGQPTLRDSASYLTSEKMMPISEHNRIIDDLTDIIHSLKR